MTRRSCAAWLAGFMLGACARSTSDAPSTDSATPERGGTLIVLGGGEPDHLLTSSGYQWTALELFRTFARQLIAYPTEGDFKSQTTLVPDLATAVPSRENGGISADFKRYTFHLRRGAKWNTMPPREVTAKDAVLGIKMMCNPVSAYGAPAYYESTITGLKEYCRAFARVAGVPADIRRFIETHEIDGVRTSDDSTVTFSLMAPASDFLHIIAMTFTAPMPEEYLDYVPDGGAFRTHTISNGPYQITQYLANKRIELTRNPAWDPGTDPLRKAYVDTIRIMLGFSAQSVQQQMQAGTADLSFDHGPTTADLAGLIATRDPNLEIVPGGDAYPHPQYLIANVLSPNGGGALRKLEVRRAIAYAVDKMAIVQVLGGSALNRPLRQVVSAGSAGFVDGYSPFPTTADRGDTAKARQLLSEARYPPGLTLKLAYGTGGSDPQAVQAIQAALARAGVAVQLIPMSWADQAKFLTDPANARRGRWDISYLDWAPDWYGNNGRSLFSVVFDGRTYGPGSYDVGGYDNAEVNRLIDRALSATSDSSAMRLWAGASRLVTEDVARIPLVESKVTVYHASRVRNCIVSPIFMHCDLTAVWLRGAARGAR